MRWVIRIAGALALLVVLAVVAVLLVPEERIARLAADRFEAATGRALTIDGPVRATFWPRAGVRAEGIAVANADWSENGPMLRAEVLEIGVDGPALLTGEVRIQRLEVAGARVLLERRADGVANWETAAAPPADAVASPTTPATGTTPARTATIDRAILTGAEILYLDAASGREVTLTDGEVSVMWEGAAADVAGSATLGGQALRFEAQAAAFRDLLDGTSAPVRAAFSAGGTDLSLDGRAGLTPLTADGRFRIASNDGFAALAAAGFSVPSLPPGFGAGSAEVISNLALLPDGTVSLADLGLILDGNRLAGVAEIRPGVDRPLVTATLSAPELDLRTRAASAAPATAAPPAEGAPSPAAASPAAATLAAIDVSGLFAADAVIALTSGPVLLDGARLDRVDMTVALDAGRAVADLRPVAAYGGEIRGEVIVNGRGGLSTRANVDLADLDLRPLLIDIAGVDRLAGRADAQISLLAAGATFDALARSLDGTVSFAVTDGEILELDIPGMIRAFDPSVRGTGTGTLFDRLTASFAVAGGVATGDDLALDAPLLTATGTGRIDIGARMLDYRFVPSLRAGEGLTLPLLIDGSWSDPRIRPDLDALARQRLGMDEEAAREKAESEVRNRLAEELEVAPETLTDRDALERAVRDRLTDRLRGLLTDR